MKDGYLLALVAALGMLFAFQLVCDKLTEAEHQRDKYKYLYESQSNKVASTMKVLRYAVVKSPAFRSFLQDTVSYQQEARVAYLRR